MTFAPDFVEAQPEGDDFLLAVARKLGRKRAARVNIDKQQSRAPR